ncbi:hypothetical protein ABT380_29220, partial [Streptomyces lydicus]
RAGRSSEHWLDGGGRALARDVGVFGGAADCNGRDGGGYGRDGGYGGYGDHRKPHGGIHTGGGGMATGSGMAAGSVLMLGGLGAGAYMLRRRNAAGSAAA